MSTTNPLWVITGAASGIGAATTRLARQRGDQVLMLDVDEQAGNALAAATGAMFAHCDVASPLSWESVAAQVRATGTPTHVHLNAGVQVAPPSAPLDAYQLEAATLEGYRRMMGINVDGVVLGLRALLPLMQPGGAIVVTASLAGITPYEVDPLYAMSKHAVVGLVRSLSGTLRRRGLRINALCPGGIDTNIIPEAQRTANAAFMSPDEIADEVLSLMHTEVSGKSWAKVAAGKPAFVVRAPGDREQPPG